jgi:hypothetical protein
MCGFFHSVLVVCRDFTAQTWLVVSLMTWFGITSNCCSYSVQMTTFIAVSNCASRRLARNAIQHNIFSSKIGALRATTGLTNGYTLVHYPQWVAWNVHKLSWEPGLVAISVRLLFGHDYLHKLSWEPGLVAISVRLLFGHDYLHKLSWEPEQFCKPRFRNWPKLTDHMWVTGSCWLGLDPN